MMSLLEAISPTSRRLLNGGASIPVNRSKIFFLLNTDPDTMNAAVVGGGLDGNDWKLKHLTVKVGQLAAFIHDPGWSRNHLRRVFGFCVGWLGQISVKNGIVRFNPVLVKISAERERQDKLFVEGKILFNCASRVADTHRKLRVLVEELGEVAKAIDQLEIAESRKSLAMKQWRMELQIELIQVAAIAVAWLESMEAK